MAVKNTLSTPQTLSKWQEFLHRLVLPVDPGVKTTVLQKLNTRTANASNIAAIIKQDPALCLLLIHEANKSLGLSGNETSSLSHTISLLGFPRITTLIRRAPDYDSNSFAQLGEFRQQLSISLHAAYQAAAWAEKNPHWQQTDIFWAALFHRAPLWVLWFRAGDKMQKLQQLRAKKNSSVTGAIEQRLLGVSIQALSASMTRSWKLPLLTQKSWQTSQRGKMRHWVTLSRLIPEKAHIAMEKMPRLQQISSNPAFIVAAANHLADQCEWDWFSPQTLRIHKIMSAAISYPLHQSIGISHQIAADASRQMVSNHALSPARQLMSFYRKADDINARPVVVEPTTDLVGGNITTKHEAIPPSDFKASPPIPTRKSAPNTATPQVEASSLDTIIERLQEQPHSFENLHEIINSTLATLCIKIGLERASASLLVIGKKELRTFYSYGTEDSPALRQFTHPLKRGDLFNKLLQKPVGLRLNGDNHSKIWPQIPGGFKQACGGTDEFFMMSVFSSEKPVALIYTDNGNSNRAMTDHQYTQFKMLCRALSQCLQSLA